VDLGEQANKTWQTTLLHDIAARLKYGEINDMRQRAASTEWNSPYQQMKGSKLETARDSRVLPNPNKHLFLTFIRICLASCITMQT